MSPALFDIFDDLLNWRIISIDGRLGIVSINGRLSIMASMKGSSSSASRSIVVESVVKEDKDWEFWSMLIVFLRIVVVYSFLTEFY